MPQGPTAAAAALAAFAAWALVACGGGGGAADLEAVVTMRDYLQSREAGNATIGASVVLPPTAAEAQEIARRSREWAVQATTPTGGPLTDNALAAPPLYFAFVHAVAAAARGDTLGALRAQHPAASTQRAQAGLMSGPQRQVFAAADTPVAVGFVQALESRAPFPAWTTFAIQSLSGDALAAEPNLRLRVDDRLSGTLAWPQAAPFAGTFVTDGGARLQTPMLRVRAPLVRHAGSGFDAEGVVMPAGWLIKITPRGSIVAWGSTGLDGALGEVVASIAAQAGAAAAVGEVVLPQAFVSVDGNSVDGRGMALAMDPVKADLRGLDDRGGTFVRASASPSMLQLEASGMRWSAGQTLDFVFSVRNIMGGGVVVTLPNPPALPPCPSRDADLRPFYLVQMDAAGAIAMLARVGAPGGTPCL